MREGCYDWSKGKFITSDGGKYGASREVIAYYMDPRNFLTEEYIFQFESTAYDGTYTKAGVEAILKNTWMHDSQIKYLNASGA